MCALDLPEESAPLRAVADALAQLGDALAELREELRPGVALVAGAVLDKLARIRDTDPPEAA